MVFFKLSSWNSFVHKNTEVEWGPVHSAEGGWMDGWMSEPVTCKDCRPKPLESPWRRGRSPDARNQQLCRRFTATLLITMGVAQEKQFRLLLSLVTQALRMAEQKSLQHRMESPGHPKAHLPISAIYPQSLAPKNFQMMFQATYSELTHVPPPQLCCTAKKPIPIWRQQIPEPVLLPTMHSWA